MKPTNAIGLGGLALLVFCMPVLAGAANPPDAAVAQASGASETPYVVKKGDTLWGISRDLLEDPLLWPRLWEQNKFISDPNKIFPGDQVGLPGKELAPAPPPAAEAPTPEPAKPEAVATPEPPKEQEKTEAPAPPPTVAQQPAAPTVSISIGR